MMKQWEMINRYSLPHTKRKPLHSITMPKNLSRHCCLTKNLNCLRKSSLGSLPLNTHLPSHNSVRPLPILSKQTLSICILTKLNLQSLCNLTSSLNSHNLQQNPFNKKSRHRILNNTRALNILINKYCICACSITILSVLNASNNPTNSAIFNNLVTLSHSTWSRDSVIWWKR